MLQRSLLSRGARCSVRSIGARTQALLTPSPLLQVASSARPSIPVRTLWRGALNPPRPFPFGSASLSTEATPQPPLPPAVEEKKAANADEDHATKRSDRPADDANMHFRVTDDLTAGSPRGLDDPTLYPDLSIHPIWTEAELKGVEVTHRPPKELHEKLAYRTIQVVRLAFDVGSGYSFGKLTGSKLLRRVIFLETVAGIPGMVGAALRHLRSLRRIKRDMGWISTLLNESENERRHMLVFAELKNPSLLFRGMVMVAQGLFWNAFFLAYVASPKFCHSFVGYLEEEAVRTYTHAIDTIEAGKLPEWESLPAPPSAVRYWRLKPDANMLDVLYNVRADEGWHRDTNHDLSELGADDFNPHAGETRM